MPVATVCRKCKGDIEPAYQGMSDAICENCFSDHAQHFALGGACSVVGLRSNSYIVTEATVKVQHES